MKARKLKIGRVGLFLVIIVSLAALLGAAGAVKINSNSSADAANHYTHINTQQSGGSKVYFTGDINSLSLLAVYRALGVSVSGKVALKVHFGEPGNVNFIKPELYRDLAETVNGTFVDSNTAFGSGRGSTQRHMQVAREHGFTFAPIDILDADGEIKLPIRNSKHLKEAILGSHYVNYDWIISVAHFKGHSAAGFGGTFKNLAVGVATPAGKRELHTNPGGTMFSSSGETFLEKIVEYNIALMDAKPGKMLYINVLNNLSVDCDCIARASGSTMADIGILASLDPVALEKASIDLIYASSDDGKKGLIERMESRRGIHQVIYAERMGLGKQAYELIKL